MKVRNWATKDLLGVSGAPLAGIVVGVFRVVCVKEGWGVERWMGNTGVCSLSFVLPPTPLFVVWLRRFPTLPHPVGCSTIGVVGLSFRVRNVAGRFPNTMTTASLVYPFPHPQQARGVRACFGGFVGWM